MLDKLRSVRAEELAPLFWPPSRLNVPSAWYGHVPFAHWLVAAIKPGTIVELGTHNGVSYSAFCEAVARLGLPTRCFAVDTWQGDEHAGFYGEDVYRDLLSFHDARYSGFSKLLRCTFDDGASHFADGSIDLLHIDGLHTYEAVRHDYEFWLPKLSDRAVVLLHDINVHERGFGVWRLFRELRRSRPVFEFLHCHGLGVIAVGADTPSAVAALCALDGNAISEVRERFAGIGERWDLETLQVTSQRLIGEHANSINVLQSRIEHERAKEEWLETLVTAERNRAIEIMATQDAELSLSGGLSAEAKTLRDELSRVKTRARSLEAEIKSLEAEISRRSETAVSKIKKTISGALSDLKRFSNSKERKLRKEAARVGFDAAWYLKCYPDVAESGMDPVLHFIEHGQAEGRIGSPPPIEFDEDWYLKCYPGIAESGMDPHVHFVLHGHAEGRYGSPPPVEFDPEWYFICYPDIAASGMDPLVHYVLYGQAEGRFGTPPPESFPTRRYELKEIRPEEITFPPVFEALDVSVIMVTRGRMTHALNCLDSIASNPPGATIEVIVSSDASNVPNIGELKRVSGITLIENDQNPGFVQSRNAAARLARGKYLYFLDDGTIVEPGAIDALVDFANRTPEAGLVGSLLLYPDGSLKEAGGIVWDDASVWNYGRMDDPGKPRYQYVREADYVSGASMLIPGAVWDELRGFDEIFAPGGHEDIDFAFRVRETGRKVYYQPSSVVCHFEGGLSEPDSDTGVEVHRTAGRRTLFKRWKEHLRRDHYPRGQHVPRACDRTRNRPVILIVDHYVPEPDRDAGSRNMFEFVRSLVTAGWDVKFYPINLKYHSGYVPPMQQLGVEVLYFPYLTTIEDWLEEYGAEIDCVMLSRPAVALMVHDKIRQFTSASILYYGHDIHHARMRSEAAVMGNMKIAEAADEMEKTERGIWRISDAVLYPSKEEAELVARLEPDVASRAASIYSFDVFEPRTSAPATSRIIFVAGYAHSPGPDGAVWFAKEIFPLIKERRPEATLSLIGSKPTEEVKNLASSDIEVTGWVSNEELAAHYASARVAAVPLRFGAGVKLKVVEPMVKGVPVVTTPVGAQGLDGIEAIVPVTTDPRTFADFVIALIEATDEEWLRQSHGQLEFVRENFSRKRQIGDLLSALAEADRVYRAGARRDAA